MKIIKKIKVGVAFAMLAALVFTTTVNAETSYTQKVKNANDTSYYHPKNEQDRINHIKKYEIKLFSDATDIYKDTYLLSYVMIYLPNWELYDLKKMEDTINEGIEARYGYFFNQGFMATDDITDPAFKEFICKCSQSDFEGFVKKCVDSSWSRSYNEKNHTTTYGKTFPGSIEYEIVYEADSKILRATNYFLN